MQSVFVIIVCHFHSHTLVAAFDIEAFVCFGAVEDRLLVKVGQLSVPGQGTTN